MDPRTRILLVALFAVILVAPVSHAQSGCKFNSDGSFECYSDEGGGEGGSGDSFWDVGGFWLGLISLLLAIAAIVVGSILVRHRRQSVGAYLERLDMTYAAFKDQPAEGIPRLAQLREEVRQRYTTGRLEDAPFLELEKRVTQYMARLRIIEIHAHVPQLPTKLVQEVERLVADGNVSPNDLARVEQLATRSRLSKAKKEPLLGLLASWAAQDQSVEAGPVAPVPRQAAAGY